VPAYDKEKFLDFSGFQAACWILIVAVKVLLLTE